MMSEKMYTQDMSTRSQCTICNKTLFFLLTSLVGAFEVESDGGDAGVPVVKLNVGEPDVGVDVVGEMVVGLDVVGDKDKGGSAVVGESEGLEVVIVS